MRLLKKGRKGWQRLWCRAWKPGGLAQCGHCCRGGSRNPIPLINWKCQQDPPEAAIGPSREEKQLSSDTAARQCLLQVSLLWDRTWRLRLLIHFAGRLFRTWPGIRNLAAALPCWEQRTSEVRHTSCSSSPASPQGCTMLCSGCHPAAIGSAHVTKSSTTEQSWGLLWFLLPSPHFYLLNISTCLTLSF